MVYLLNLNLSASLCFLRCALAFQSDQQAVHALSFQEGCRLAKDTLNLLHAGSQGSNRQQFLQTESWEIGPYEVCLSCPQLCPLFIRHFLGFEGGQGMSNGPQKMLLSPDSIGKHKEAGMLI